MTKSYTAAPALVWRGSVAEESGGFRHRADWSPDEYCFDYDFPFRAFVRYLADAVGAELVLPEQEAFEECIEGELRLDGARIAVHIEHALLYVSLESADWRALERVVRASRALAPMSFDGYGVEDV